MEHFTEKVADQVLSTTGVVGALLLGAIFYLVRELKRERLDHTETRKKLYEVSEKAITSSVTTTEVLSSFRGMVETALRDKGRATR
jgi:hypothetical protein